ncbi:YidB family protein [Peristeroidobacter soli]|jgi:uncharacterized protein YidB (DUF937 family)|uniref:YidB family protein n=1 Tax=Peristeroidobacter soli TaxID=2497877 RepID=UPI00101CB3CB|nr:YidB family protein [Peristeroidobacter soli]
MGLLDQISGALGGLGQGQSGSQAAGGGSGAALLPHLLSMFSQPGALSNLANGFQSAGLGNVLQSWIGTGQNLPISGDQVKQVLGTGNVADLGARAGLNESEASNALAGLLPQVVDKLTPNGSVPSEGELGSALSSLGKLFH